MKTFSLPAIRLAELVSVVDAIPPKDLGDLKSIRLSVGIVNDLKAALKDYSEKSEALTVLSVDLMKPYQEKFNAFLGTNPTKEAQDNFAKDLDKDFQAELNSKFATEIKALDEAGKVVVSVELGEEKFSKLKEFFTKYGPERYLNKKIFVEVADALGLGAE